MGQLAYWFFGSGGSGLFGTPRNVPVITSDGKYFILNNEECRLTSDVAVSTTNQYIRVVIDNSTIGTSLAVNSAGTTYIRVGSGKKFFVGPLCGPYSYTINFPLFTDNIIKNIGTNFSGLKVAVTTSADGIWISNNMAKTWSQSSASTAINWNEIVISDDGNFMVASSTGNKIYTSLDGGLTWQATSSPDANWSSLSMTSNGQVITAIAQNPNTLTNSIYMSKDYGNSWQQVNPGGSMPLNGWKTVFITASGNKIYADNENGQLWELKSSGIQGGSFDSITLQYNGDNTWSITNMTGNNLRNY